MPQGAILTNVGLSKIASATPLDQLNVVQIAVGDGNGGYPTLTPDMTGLVNEVWRGPASNPIRDPNNANILIFEAQVPALAGPFSIREQAIFDDEGDMIAIGQTSLVEKPDPSSAVGVVATMRLHIALSNASQVDLFYTDTAATHHNSLTNRDDPDSHPASAIAGVSEMRDEIINGKVFPEQPEKVIENGDTIPTDTTHLRVLDGGEFKIFEMSPTISGQVTSISGNQIVTSGGSSVLKELPKDLITVKSSQLRIQSAADLDIIRVLVSLTGVEHLRVEFDQPLNISDGPGTYCELLNTSLKTLVVDGLRVTDTATYTANFQICRLFDLDGIDKVCFVNTHGKSTVTDVQQNNFNVGLGFVRSKNSKMFHFDGELYNGYRPYEVWGTDLVTGRSYCEDTRYNGTFQKGCGVIRVELVGKRLRRDFYLYDCKGGELNVDGEDTYGHSPINLIVSTDGDEVGCDNLTIKYKQRNSLSYSPTSRLAPLYLGFQTLEVSPGVYAVGTAHARNVKIIYDVEGDYGTVIDHTKLINSSSDPDTVARGYEMSNISIEGRFKTTKQETTRLINFKNAPNWFSGDIVRNYTMKNLVVESDAPYNFALNLEMLGDALVGEGALVFENFTAERGVILDNIDYGRSVKFKGYCDLFNFYSSPTREDIRSGCYRNDYVIIPSGQDGIDFMIVDPERSNNHIRIKCDAFTQPEQLNSSVSFEVIGQITYNASGSASNNTTLNKQNENLSGTIVNPVLTANNNTGVLNISFPEWLDDDVRVRLEVSLDYEPYTNKYNTSIYGLASKNYEFKY